MVKIKLLKKIEASLKVEADKSISHRAIILSSLSKKKTKIINFLDSEDTFTTFEAFKRLNVNITYRKPKKEVLIKGGGKYLHSKDVVLQMKNSATTLRLISGVLSAQEFSSTLKSFPSLEKRPMRRITEPLRAMGADIRGRLKNKEEYPPLRIKPVSCLKGINYKLPVSSAQVKSCLLLAGLYAEEKTLLYELYKSRDHTERMLKFFGAKIKVRGRKISLEASELTPPSELYIPQDFSSSAYFIALATLREGSRLLLRRVLVNPTRTGFLRVLERMGAKIKLMNLKKYFEPYGDILVKSSSLRGTKVNEEEIPLMIDEVPLLFVLASFAKGKTQIYGLRELKVKETDRIQSMEYNLKKMGVKFLRKEYLNSQGEPDIMIEIEPPLKFKEIVLKSFSDHRTAMSLIVASLSLGKEAVIDEVDCINKSFPMFLSCLRRLDK